MSENLLPELARWQAGEHSGFVAIMLPPCQISTCEREVMLRCISRPFFLLYEACIRFALLGAVAGERKC